MRESTQEEPGGPDLLSASFGERELNLRMPHFSPVLGEVGANRNIRNTVIPFRGSHLLKTAKGGALISSIIPNKKQRQTWGTRRADTTATSMSTFPSCRSKNRERQGWGNPSYSYLKELNVKGWASPGQSPNWKNVSEYMGYAEIDVKRLKSAVNAVLDHLIEDLKLEKLVIEERDNFYWSCPPRERYDASKKPSEWWTGRLSDDVHFADLIQRGQNADISYSLVHVSPLLRYIGEKVQK